MPLINIPESVLPGIKEIGLLSDKEIRKLYDILRSFPKGSTVEDLKEKLEAAFPGETGDQIADTISSFGYLLIRNEGSPKELADEITDSYFLQSKDEALDDGLSDQIRERLNDILVSCDFLIPIYEAFRSVWEGNVALINHEISNEIILLNDKTYNKPAQGVMIHKLRISTKLNNKGKDHVIVCDTDDLLQFKKRIEKALLEAEDMKKSYSSFVNLIEL